MKNTKRDTPPLRDPRPNSGVGRPPKPDRDLYAKVTVHLKRETISRLKKGGGKYFGQFLQDHLDRYPLPSRATYLWRQEVNAKHAERAAAMKPKANRALKAWGKELTRKLIKEFGQHDGTRKAGKSQPVAH